MFYVVMMFFYLIFFTTCHFLIKQITAYFDIERN